MTRESKLALIVGFGLVLFVGILVSDHFSAGQRQEAAHLLAQRGALRGAAAPISIQPLVDERMVNARNASLDQGHRAPSDATGPQTAGAAGSAVAGTDGGTGGAHGSPRGPDGTAPPVAPVPDRAPPRGGEVVIGPSSTPTVPTVPTAPPNSTPNSGEPTVAAKLYPVKEGETLYSICASQYGDGSLWKALADFNKGAVPNPSRMRKGVTLRIPPIEVLKPGAVARASNPPAGPPPAPGASPGAPAPRTSAPPSAPVAATTTYTVKSGETLSDIARRTLGSTSRWKDVARINEDVIRDPHALQPGTVIRIPSQG